MNNKQLNKKAKKIEDLKNDVVFKYVMTSPINDYYLLKSIIEAYIGIRPQTIHIENPELYPGSYDEKEFILDIKATDELGRIYDIEMQTYPLNGNQINRFESYSGALVSGQAKRGEAYDKTIHSCYVLVLYDGAMHKNLVSSYLFIEESSYDHLPYARGHLIVVNMANIQKVKKPIEEMNNAELYTYAFKNGIGNDILKVGNEGMNIMKERLESFNQDAVLQDYALRLRLKKQADYLDRLDAIEQGEQRGIQKGIQKGKEEGKLEGKLETLVKTCKHMMEKCNYTLEEAFDIAGVEKEYQEAIRNQIEK